MNDAERIKDLEERVDVLGKMVSNLLWAFNEHFTKTIQLFQVTSK